jgi:hypothetical protein
LRNEVSMTGRPVFSTYMDATMTRPLGTHGQASLVVEPVNTLVVRHVALLAWGPGALRSLIPPHYLMSLFSRESSETIAMRVIMSEVANGR